MVVAGENAAAGGGDGATDAPRLLGEGDAVREFDAGEMAPVPERGVVERLVVIPNRAMAAAAESALVFTARAGGFAAATGFTGVGGF